jgi:opacity protein-like surface antigen
MLRAGAIALAVVAGFALSAPAFAADLPVKAPPRAAPAVSSWTGLYVGGSVGARWTDTTWTTTCIGGFANCPLNGLSATRLATNNPVDFDSTSFRGGIFVGFNWQVAQHWILGIEGDWAWADNNKTARGIPGTVLPVDFPNTLDRSEVKHSWERERAGARRDSAQSERPVVWNSRYLVASRQDDGRVRPRARFMGVRDRFEYDNSGRLDRRWRPRMDGGSELADPWRIPLRGLWDL